LSNQVVKEVGIAVARNAVRDIRESLLMSKAELARKAGLSPITVERIEKGKGCRLETMRKIILALGYDLADRAKVFPQA
jgi:DNA-binding XRE family transcriptional regulator